MHWSPQLCSSTQLVTSGLQRHEANGRTGEGNRTDGYAGEDDDEDRGQSPLLNIWVLTCDWVVRLELPMQHLLPLAVCCSHLSLALFVRNT